MIYNVAGINVIFSDKGYTGSDREAMAYYEQAVNLHPEYLPRLLSITIKFHGEEAELEYTLRPAPFERIRRITGYLVGSTERWNSGKRAELGDRVAHDAIA